jgi:hypothetical protein
VINGRSDENRNCKKAMKVTIEVPQPPETFRCTYPKNAVTTDVVGWYLEQINTVPDEAQMPKKRSFKPAK